MITERRRKMKRILKRAATLALASTLVLGAVPAMAADNSTKSPTQAKEEQFVAKKVKRIIYWYNTTTKGTATSFKVIKNRKNVKVAPIVDYVILNGKKYKVTKVGKNTFKGCKKIKKFSYRPTKALKFAKGAFNGVDTKKTVFIVNKKMKASQFKLLKKRLKKAGYKGTIKKGKVKA